MFRAAIRVKRHAPAPSNLCADHTATREPHARSRAVVAALLIGLELACRTETARIDEPSASASVPRIAMTTRPRSKAEYETLPTPLVYGGGFLNKTLAFETLVTLDAKARPCPALAESWTVSDDGRVWTFVLRPDVHFHDGANCDAHAVAEHMHKWIGGKEDAFIAASTRIASVDALDERTVRFTLREPHYLLADLALPNPMSIVGPRARRDELEPCLDGTGPWRIAEYEPMKRFRFERNENYAGARTECSAFELALYVVSTARDATALWGLERGHVDAVVEDWNPSIPRERARALAQRDGFALDVVRGSAVSYLAFGQTRSAFADVERRRRVAAAIDRARLIEIIEAGFAEPVTGLFAPWVADWPQGRATSAHAGGEPFAAELLLAEGDPTLLRGAFELTRQLATAGITLELALVDGGEFSRRLWAGEYELVFGRTWGTPYDPQATLSSRFGPQPAHRTAVETPASWSAPELDALVKAYQAAVRDDERRALAARIQHYFDEVVPLVPLYAAQRIAVRRSDVTGLFVDASPYAIDVHRLHVTR